MIFLQPTSAIPLDNWRATYYAIAVRQGMCTSSPSGLFWDDLPTPQYCMNPALWPDSTRHINAWFFESSLQEDIRTIPLPYVNDKSSFSGQIYSDFIFKKWKARTILDVNELYQYDPLYPWKKDRFSSGRFNEAYIQYSYQNGFFRFGRLNRNWGPFHDRSVILSNNPFPYDAFEWQLFNKSLEFRYLFAAFPKNYTSMDLNDLGYDRYFSGHALNYIFGTWGSLGITETILFAQNSGFPHFSYLNPCIPYTVINTNAEGDANLMLGFQGWVHPYSPKITLKGQLIIDDIQVDDKVSADQEPTHWAYDLGLYWTDPFPISLQHNFYTEYRYLSKWIYTVTDINTSIGQRYMYLGRSLGVQDIDGDNLVVAATICGNNYWAATIGYRKIRQDTNTVYTFWNSNESLGYRHETSLSKRAFLKTTHAPFMEINGYFKNYADFRLIYENRFLQDKKKSKSYTFDPYLQLNVSVHYRTNVKSYTPPDNDRNKVLKE